MDLGEYIGLVLLMVINYIHTSQSSYENSMNSKLAEVSRHLRTGVTLSWNRTLLDSADSCEISYTAHGSRNATIFRDFKPSNYSSNITGLLPNTQYELHIVCYYQHHQLSNNVTKVLQNFTFSTALTSTLEPSTHSTWSTVTSSSTFDNLSSSTTVTDPSVVKTKMTSGNNSADVILTVVFGLVALGVLITTSYYLMKKWRRRQRLRRFLQYSQHENEPFQQMQDDNEDDAPMF